MNRRFRRCQCMYNTSNNNQDALEEKCLDVCSSNWNEQENNECECGFDEDELIDVFPNNPMLAQNYVPIQFMDRTFRPSVGLKNGTIFPELVSPYEPCQSMEEIAFIEKTNNIGEGCNK